MWVIIAILALIILPVIIGFFMPLRYEGQAVVEFDKSVQQVWEALQDVKAHPMTGKMMKEGDRDPA